MEDEERQKKLEAGKEKFAAYLKKKNASSHQSEQKKKKKNEVEESCTCKESLSSSFETSERINLDMSCRSNGTSEDEEKLQSRVKELEEILSGKEAALEAAYEELSALKELSSLDVSTGMFDTDYKAHLEEYHKRLQEFQEAVQDRERIIGQLSSSLQQALQTRDDLQLQGDHLAQEVALLQRQLKATTESIQSHQWDTGIKPQEYLALQNKMLALEAAVNKNESLIDDLRNSLRMKEDALRNKSEELEKKSQELSQQKTKSANEIQKLMREVEELHQKCALQASNQNSIILDHEGQMASLQSELEENFGLQLVQIKEEFRNRFNEEKQVMEDKHTEELSSCESLIAKLSEMSSRTPTESENYQLHETSEMKKQMEIEIAQLKESSISEMDALKLNIADLEKKLEEEVKIKQNMEKNMLEMRNQYEKEFTSYKEQVEDLNVKLQEVSKAEANFSVQIMECQQSHEMELVSYKQQVDALNLRLQEASSAEENFPKVLAAHKHSLECEVSRYKEENEALNAQLQSIKNSEITLQKEKSDLIATHNVSISSYEQQSQDLRMSLKTAEENLQGKENELSYFKAQLEESNKTIEEYAKEVADYREEVSTLNVKLEESLLVKENLRLEMDSCKKTHKEEFNLLKERFDSELLEKSSISKCQSHEEELSLCKQQIEFLNTRLQDANEAEKCHVSEITACQAQLKEYKDQVETLDRRFNEELVKAQETFSKEIALKSQEIEALHECLREASKSEEKYKSEILSNESKIADLKQQLEEGDETEKQKTNKEASYQEQLAAYSDQIETLKKLAGTHDELQAYKQQVETLKESFHFEVSQLTDSHSSQMNVKDEHHAAEIASLNKKVEDLIVELTEISNVKDTLEKEKITNSDSHRTEVAMYRQQLEELNIQLQKNSRNEEKYVADLAQYQTQLTSHKNIIESLYSKFKDETSQIKELHAKEINDLKNNLSRLENTKITLEASLAEVVKQRDEVSNTNRAQLEEVTVQYLKLQSLLAGREEVEESLERHVKDLQAELQIANENVSKLGNVNSQLQEMTVQYLKLEGLMAGKEEMIQVLTEQIQHLEERLTILMKNSEEKSKKEFTLLSQLKSLKIEKDELFEKFKLLEQRTLSNITLQAHDTTVTSVESEGNDTSSLPIEDSAIEQKLPPTEYATLANEQTVITIENNDTHNYVQDYESEPPKRQKRDVTEVEKPLFSHNWLEKLITLENQKIDLSNKVESIELKLQEKEFKEKMYIEEINCTELHCKELEEKLFHLEKIKIEMQTVVQEKKQLELEIINLKNESEAFQTLNNQLTEERISKEEKLYQELREKCVSLNDENNSDKLEQLILDLGNKVKEILFLKEKLKIQEQMCQSLNNKIIRLEEAKEEIIRKFHTNSEDLNKVRTELEDSWKQNQATRNELGTIKKELALLKLQKQQLELNQSRTLQMINSQNKISPVYATSVHNVIEELAAEVEALKSSLECEQHCNEKLALELEMVRNSGTTDVNSNDSGNGMLELQHKLEFILKSNTELVAEKEALLDKLRNQQQLIGKLQQAGGYEQVENWMMNLDRQQTDLMTELRAYREQHTSLAELVGSTGVLQETLYRQKQELLHKFEEKAEIEKLLEKERSELKSAQLKIHMMEHQLLEKDKISQELSRQKHLLEQDLHEIEDRLRDQEDRLETQKLALETEIQARDLHIRHWQLELKRKQVEMNAEQAVKKLDEHLTTEVSEVSQEQRLEAVCMQLDELHLQAMARLRHHLEEQFTTREVELQRNLTAEIATLKQLHKEQLLELQRELDSRTKEIEGLVSAELHKQLGISQNMAVRMCADDLTKIKEKQKAELEEMKNTLDEQQKEVYTVLREKFERFAEEQITLAVRVLQEEHKTIHEQEISGLISKHTEELGILQSKLEAQRQQELLLLHQELSKKHKDEMNAIMKELKLEFSVLKQPFDKLTRVNIHQLRQELHTDYSSSVRDCVQAWYYTCQERVEALNKQIDNVWQSRQQDKMEISSSSAKIDKLLETKEQLLTQIEVLQEKILKHHTQALQKLESLFDSELAKLAGKIDQMKKAVQEGATVASMRDQITKLEEEKEDLQTKHRLALDMLSQEQGVANLRQELEAKHAKEMEKLRRYFEQKCADLEKHYSEEVFSQHSRKLSGSSSGSEELVSDMYYAGGDHNQRLTALTHICDSYAVEPSFKDLEEHYRSDFEKRLLEYRDQLDTVKLDLEKKYQSEMELLREEYESKVEELVRDLSNTHKVEIQNLEKKHAKEMLNMKEKMQIESAAELSTVKLECTQEVDRMRQTHQQELVMLKNTYEDELKKQIEQLTEQMKREEVECVEAVKSQLLNKHVRDIQELEDSFADRVVDEIGKTSTDSALQKVDLEHKISLDLKKQFDEEHKRKVAEIEEKHTREMEAERKLLTEQFDHVTNMLKKNAEEEQEKFILNQKAMMSNFVKQHQEDLQALKIQLEEEYKKLYKEKLHQTKDKYEKEIKVLKEKMASLVKNSDTALPVQQLQKQVREKDARLAEMQAMHEQELEQVRKHCEGQLHDEVEQARHDIVRALEEQIQALLENDSQNTPRELIELQDKFTTRYKRQLDQLKEEHSKEVERLKQESELELQSLSEKYSQLEEQHQEHLEHEMTLLTQKVDLNFTNTGTFIERTVQELQSLKRQIVQLEKTKCEMQVRLGDVSDDTKENTVSILNADLEHLIKERDGLRKMTCTLRYLLRELIEYFTVCEDELNNTLIGELLKVESDTSKNNSTLVDQAVSSIAEDAPAKSGENEEKSNNNIKSGETFSAESSVTSLRDISLTPEQDTGEDVSMTSKSLVLATPSSRKVHFAPDASGIMSLIEEDRLIEYMEKNRDVSVDFRSELEGCLERLKAEATAVLGLSSALPKTVQVTREAVLLLEEKISTLTHRLETEVKSKDELLTELQKLQENMKEAEDVQIQLDSLEIDLQAARSRVAELERELGKREDISEGYGENVQPGLVRRLHNMAQLQDKAREVLSGRSGESQKSPHLQLIEELCQEGDRLSDEARREREDLQQQVDVADKQLRATRQFLEEQAAEREQERDDFLKEISKLQEQLRERDRERSEHEQLAKEDALQGSEQVINVQTVESLEQQVKEAAALQKESDLKKEELETELKAAVDKIWVLRDIIGELENHVETKTQHESSLEQQLREFHAVLEQQSQNHQELAEELDSLRVDSGKSELTERINHLEEQLRKHRLHVEQFQSNSTAVKQMKAQLRDLEAVIDKKTKDLESLHANTSSVSCSSPSEDISIREHLDSIRCETPESQSQSPVCLPLDELHRLQDKLQRHSRAEEVALKRTRDLEMQLKGIKRNEEEVTAERDVLQERMEEQLVKISALQSRLDEQRRKTDGLLKEANMELQVKVRDQELEINKLRELLENKDKEVKMVKSTLEETRRIVAAQESEWNSSTRQEIEVQEKLKELCDSLNIDTSALQDGLDGSISRIIPIKAMIQLLMDNRDVHIEKLQSQVDKLLDQAKQNLDLEKQKKLQKLGEGFKTVILKDESPGPFRSSGPDRTEGILVPCEDDMLFTSPRNIAESETEPNMDDSSLKEMLLQKDMEIVTLKIKLTEQMNRGLSQLRNELDEKNARISECEFQLENLPRLETEIESLQRRNEALEAEKQNCQVKFTDIEIELSKALENLEEKEGELTMLQSYRQESHQQIVQYTKEVENLKVEIRELQQCKEESESLKVQVLNYKEENSKLVRHTELLKEKLVKLVEENKNLKAELFLASVTEEKQITSSSIGTTEPKIKEIVRKIDEEGISSLCFNDLSYLHQQICKVAGSTIIQDSPSGFDVAAIAKCFPLDKSDEREQELFQQKIASLENESAQKQKETEKKVIRLESEIQREKRHIEDLKEKFNEEQQKNIDLQNQLRLQTRNYNDVQIARDLFQKQLSYQEDCVREFIVQLEQERARIRQFEDDLLKERNCVKQLQTMLEAERQRARFAKLQDSEFIENLRLKLEAAMSNEKKLRFQLEQEKLVRESSEKLGSGYSTCNNGSSPAFGSQGKLEVEQERYAKLELELQKEQRKTEQLEAAVEKEQQLGLHKIQIEKDIVHQLKRELLSLEGQRNSLNSQLMHVREQLSLRQVESETLERKVRMLQEAEVHRQKKRLSEQEEFDKNRRALQKAQSLQYDLEQKIIDLEQEVARLKQELLEKKIQEDLVENRATRSPSPKVSSPVLEKLKSVNVLLEQHMTENAEVALTLSRLTEERQKLQSRIRDLEEQLRSATRERRSDIPDSVHATFAAERAIWAQEKAALKVALAQAESDALRRHKTGDGADADERVKHLFGKYLRAESYRKALVWQKRYLLVVLGGYQESEAITLSRLAQLSGEQETLMHHHHHHHTKSDRKPRTRFRTIAIVVIALSRMRYMVRRWRLGRRIGSGTVLSRGYSESALSSAQSSYHGPRRRGSSTSVNSLGASRASLQPHRYGPLSPPSRDQATIRRWQTDFVAQHHMRSSESIPISSLRPSHVSEYVDRFDELQRRLGLGITSPPPP